MSRLDDGQDAITRITRLVCIWCISYALLMAFTRIVYHSAALSAHDYVCSLAEYIDRSSRAAAVIGLVIYE